jgi:hypothetical protein
MCSRSSVPSVRVYVHYLRLTDMIILPEYSYRSSSAGLDYSASSRLTVKRFDDVVTINCDKLALCGKSSLHSFADRSPALPRYGRFSQ